MRRDTVQRGIGTASLLLYKNILHQFLLLADIFCSVVVPGSPV